MNFGTMGAGFGGMGRVGAVGFEPEALTLFAAMSVQPDATRQGVINTLIKGLKDASLWTKLNKLYVCAAHDDQAGRVEWKNPGTHTLSKNGTLTFTTNVGFASNGTTGYLNVGTGFESFGTFAQDSNHFGAWVSGTGSAVVTWGRADANGRFVTLLNSSGNFQYRDAFSVLSGTANANVAGHFLVTRRAAGAIELYKNAVSFATPTTASESIGSGNAWLLASTTSFAPATANLEIAHAGIQLSAGEALALYTLLAAYRVSL